MRMILLVVCGSLLLPLSLRAQPGDSSEEKGTYLGVLFAAVPEVVYDQIPDLPRGQGVVVTHVLPDSPAALAKLARHDIILKYDEHILQSDDKKITNCEYFAQLIRADKPDRKVKLLLLRGGKQLNVEVTLTTGTVLRIAKSNATGASKTTDDPTPKGTVKATGPGSVSVTALPLGENKIKLTIEYYEEGRLATASCSGNPKEIEDEIDKLPNRRVQALAKSALNRIRDLNLQTTSPKEKTPADPKH
jgi:hypothetical protein